MLEWTRNLIRLRRGCASLNNGELDALNVRFDEEKKWIVMDRGGVKVMLNLGKETVEFENPESLPVALASGDGVVGQGAKIVLPPDRVAILTKENASSEEDRASIHI
jgi:maltooligosyltrehalose trehalohydrolase